MNNEKWILVTCGRDHVLALTENGNVYSWGCNNDGPLGLNHLNSKNIPCKVDSKEIFVSLAAGWCHSVALNNKGEIFSCGLNSSGQLGTGSTTFASEFKPITTLSKVKNIYCGNCHTLALLEDKTIYIWGYNGYGQLSFGDIKSRQSPTQWNKNLNGDVSFINGEYEIFPPKNNVKICFENNITNFLSRNEINSIKIEMKNEKKVFSLDKIWIETACPKLITFINDIISWNIHSVEIILYFLHGCSSLKNFLKKYVGNVLELLCLTIYYSDILELGSLRLKLLKKLEKELLKLVPKKNEKTENNIICEESELIKVLYFTCENDKTYSNNIRNFILKFFLDNNLEPNDQCFDKLPREVERIFTGKIKLGEIVIPKNEDLFSKTLELLYDKRNLEGNTEICFSYMNEKRKAFIHPFIVKRSEFLSKGKVENGKMFLDLELSPNSMDEFIYYLYFDKISDNFNDHIAIQLIENGNLIIKDFKKLEECCFGKSKDPTLENCLIYLSKHSKDFKNSNDKKFENFLHFTITNYQEISTTNLYAKLNSELRSFILEKVVFNLQNQLNNLSKIIENNVKI